MPRRQRETGDDARHDRDEDDYPVVKDLVALMEARYAPADHRGWPVTRCGGWKTALPTSCIGEAGWNHLLRGGLRLSLAEHCGGNAEPVRVHQVKEKFGQLVFYIDGRGGFRNAITVLLAAAWWPQTKQAKPAGHRSHSR